MKNFYLVGLLGIIIAGCNTASEKISKTESIDQINKVLKFQQEAWNEGDIDKFMEGYWKSDSMQFVGDPIRQGWQATLERYKQNYPDREAMGTLQFDIWQIVRISDDAYLVTGKYTLIRSSDKPTGMFTLIFRLKNGKWVITYDHTS
jgi:hypothetical protein